MVIVAPVFSVPVGYGRWRLRSHSDEGSPLVNHVTRTPPSEPSKIPLPFDHPLEVQTLTQSFTHWAFSPRRSVRV
jgi:hypothetical protein